MQDKAGEGLIYRSDQTKDGADIYYKGVMTVEECMSVFLEVITLLLFFTVCWL